MKKLTLDDIRDTMSNSYDHFLETVEDWFVPGNYHPDVLYSEMINACFLSDDRRNYGIEHGLDDNCNIIFLNTDFTAEEFDRFEDKYIRQFHDMIRIENTVAWNEKHQ